MTFMTHFLRFASGAIYNANAVVFDGVNDYLSASSAFSGGGNGQNWTISFWIRTSASARQYIICTDNNSNEKLYVRMSASGTIELQGRNVSAQGNAIVLTANTSETINDGSWHHIAISIGLASTSTRHIYIDGMAATVTWTAYNTSGQFDYSGTHIVGANRGLTDRLNADIAEVIVFDEYLDLSNSSNLGLFIKSNKPADPTKQTQRRTMLYGETATWHTNKGTRGGFTLTGALVTSSNLPVSI